MNQFFKYKPAKPSSGRSTVVSVMSILNITGALYLVKFGWIIVTMTFTDMGPSGPEDSFVVVALLFFTPLQKSPLVLRVYSAELCVKQCTYMVIVGNKEKK